MAPITSILSGLLVLSLSFASVTPRQLSGCQALDQKLPGVTFFSNEAAYQSGIVEVWSQTCRVQSTCLFEPRTAQEVADAVAILRRTNTKFALRGGGHMPIPGANGITDGVTISLERMTTLKYADAKKSVLQIGTGLRWESVYNFTSKDTLGVAGGRFGPVGVPGLLLGGGISYFGSIVGWSASTVSNFEVVLANSTIVNANATANKDLFWALKGGSNNFGVVTRFDLKTFAVDKIWGGTAIYTAAALDPIIKAYAAYTVNAGGISDSATHIDPTVQVNVSTGAISLLGIYTHLGADADPPSTRNFTRIPATTKNFSLRSKLNSVTNETSGPFFSDRSARQIWASAALLSSAKSVYMINQTFFEMAFSPEFKAIPNLLAGTTYQTLSSSFIKAAKAAGGDPMDIVDVGGNGINVALYNVQWKDAQYDAQVNQVLEKYIDLLNQRAKNAGLDYDYIFLNDAAPFQKTEVLEKYGRGQSLAKMRTVAKKYDPTLVFQKLVPGGFKLGSF